MSPYKFVQEATKNGESLLCLCSGIGLELNGVQSKDITAVDIYAPYLERLKEIYPNVKTVKSSALTYTRRQLQNTVDVISIIDGIEHFTHTEGLQLIIEMKRVCRKEILLFTPDGYLTNQPHNAWDIEGGDEFQLHRSGWTLNLLTKLGFETLDKWRDTSQHGQAYTALMMSFKK